MNVTNPFKRRFLQRRRVHVKDISSTFLAGLILFSTATAMSADRLVLVAGGGTNDASGNPATQAVLREPFGVDFDSAGNLFIIEMARGNRLLKVDGRGVLMHVAGTGLSGNHGDDDPVTKASAAHAGEGGGWGRNRTADTRIFSPLLYRLSYPAERREQILNEVTHELARFRFGFFRDTQPFFTTMHAL